MGEQKYKTAVQFIPKVFVIITSNSIWNFKNSTTAMARRFIYFSMTYKPKVTNNILFNLNSLGEASGDLVEYLPSLILWALNCPDKYLEVLELGGEKVTESISPDSQIRTNPLKVWALDNLEPDSSEKLSVGNSKDPKTLYGSYSIWADRYNSDIGTVRTNQFSSLLLDVLISMNWDVSRKRIATGSVIMGVKFRDCPIINSELIEDNSELDFNLD